MMCSEEMVSPRTMEVVYNLAKEHPLDQNFLNDFINCCFKECVNNQKKARIRDTTIFQFMNELINFKRFDVSSKIENWIYYSNHFQHRKVAKDFNLKLKAWMAEQQGK